MWSTLGNWINVILSLAVISITLWRDNPSGNIAQRCFMVGTWATFFLYSLKQIWAICVTPIMKGDYIKVIPFALGLLFIALYFRPIRHLSRFPTSIIVGVSMGLAFRGMVETQLIGQAKAAVMPLTGVAAVTAVQNLWIIVTTLLTILYFTFSFGLKEGSAFNRVRRISRIAIMLMFGVALGQDPWSMTDLIIGRFIFILNVIRGTV